jgi:hypothetical protein
MRLPKLPFISLPIHKGETRNPTIRELLASASKQILVKHAPLKIYAHYAVTLAGRKSEKAEP